MIFYTVSRQKNQLIAHSHMFGLGLGEVEALGSLNIASVPPRTMSHHLLHHFLELFGFWLSDQFVLFCEEAVQGRC